MTYDAAGNKIKEVDPQGKQRLYQYDQRKHLTKVADASGKETNFTYNLEGRLLKQTDADGKAEFEFAAYPFKFRADVAGKHYWSSPITITEGVDTNIYMNAD
jgi:YD repeat-containing protein